MKAMYYLGQTIGKTRKDKTPFYVVNILALDRFGCISASPLFVNETQYNEILDQDFQPGESVTVSMTFNGVFQGIESDSRYAPLEFDKRTGEQNRKLHKRRQQQQKREYKVPCNTIPLFYQISNKSPQV